MRKWETRGLRVLCSFNYNWADSCRFSALLENSMQTGLRPAPFMKKKWDFGHTYQAMTSKKI